MAFHLSSHRALFAYWDRLAGVSWNVSNWIWQFIAHWLSEKNHKTPFIAVIYYSSHYTHPELWQLRQNSKMSWINYKESVRPRDPRQLNLFISIPFYFYIKIDTWWLGKVEGNGWFIMYVDFGWRTQVGSDDT